MEHGGQSAAASGALSSAPGASGRAAQSPRISTAPAHCCRVLHAVQDALGFVPAQAVPRIAAGAEPVARRSPRRHQLLPRLPFATPRAVTCCACAAPRRASRWAPSAIAELAQRETGVGFGATTADGELTLEAVYCLGNCACAPAAMLDGEVHGRLNEAGVRALLRGAGRDEVSATVWVPRDTSAALGRRRARRARDPSSKPSAAVRPSRSAATARAGCTGWSRWSKSRPRAAASPTARSRPRMSIHCSKPASWQAGRIALHLGRIDAIPYLAAPGAPELRAHGRDRSAQHRGLRSARRLRRAARRAGHERRADRAAGHRLGPARSRRRGLSDRHQVEDRAGRPGDTEVHRLQRRRGRLGHLLRSHADGRRSVRADRGHDHRGPRGRREAGLRLPPLRVSAGRAHARSRRSRSPPAPAIWARACCGSGKRFQLEVRRGAGAYICGEETALLESLEGKRGMVRYKPPLPALQGLFGKPTVVNNVITFALACRSSSRRARRSTATTAWAARAARCRSSWPATSSTADWSRRPSASRCASCCTTSAAGSATGRPIRAVQVGGPLGAFLPESLFDTPLDYEAFAQVEGMIGHGGVVVFDDTVDMAQMARYAMEFCAIESCGKCTPCRIGSTRGVEVIDRIVAGRGARQERRAAAGSVRHHAARVAVRAGRDDAVSRC